MIRHPTFGDLNKYADGELPESRRARIARHLANCSACRRSVQSIEELTRAAVTLPERAVPDGILGRINARRAAGDRLILPTDGVPQRSNLFGTAGPRRAWLAAAAALVFLIVGIPMVDRVAELGAVRIGGELTITPEQPRRGSEITFKYRDASVFGDVPTLLLRARYRTPADGSYNNGMQHIVAGELERMRSGLYRGQVQLPDSVVYATFSVETPDGDRVDSNGRRLWELLVHDEEGRPLADALVQRSNDMMGRNWELAFESVKDLARLYPDDPRGLSLVSFFGPLVVGEQTWADSSLPAFRERYAELDRRLRDHEDLDGDQLEDMMHAARRVEDTLAYKRWRSALMGRFPRHTQSLQQYIIYDLLSSHYTDTARVLSELDSIWRDVEHEPVKEGPGYSQLVSQGLSFAVGSGDAEAARVWADRYSALYPSAGSSLARRIVTVPELRNRAISLLEAELDRLQKEPPEDRRLYMTVGEYRRWLEQPIQGVLSVLGRALLGDGQTGQAAGVLERAGHIGWETGIFRQIADAQLQLGDTTAALATLARVAADPGTVEAFVDTVRDRVGDAFDDVVWRSEVLAAREIMRERTLREATTRALPERIRLVMPDGSTDTFRAITDGRAAFVTMWSRSCGWAVRALPDIERIARDLEARGVAVLVIAEQPPSQELDRFLQESGVDLPLYHDMRREATRAFNSWGTPEYFITDREGRIRFEYTDLGSVLRQADALTAEGSSRPEP